MGKLAFYIVAHKLNNNDKQFARQALKNYHSFKNVVWHGDLFRLVNPHKNNIAALMYVAPDKDCAVVFNYLANFRFMQNATPRPEKLAGLDAAKSYTVKEINVYPDTWSRIHTAKVYTGDFLMKEGINSNINLKNTSVVLEVNAVE